MQNLSFLFLAVVLFHVVGTGLAKNDQAVRQSVTPETQTLTATSHGMQDVDLFNKRQSPWDTPTPRPVSHGGKIHRPGLAGMHQRHVERLGNAPRDDSNGDINLDFLNPFKFGNNPAPTANTSIWFCKGPNFGQPCCVFLIRPEMKFQWWGWSVSEDCWRTRAINPARIGAPNPNDNHSGFWCNGQADEVTVIASVGWWGGVTLFVTDWVGSGANFQVTNVAFEGPGTDPNSSPSQFHGGNLRNFTNGEHWDTDTRGFMVGW